MSFFVSLKKRKSGHSFGLFVDPLQQERKVDNSTTKQTVLHT